MPSQYERVVQYAQQLTLQAYDKVFYHFRDLSLPYLGQIHQLLDKYSRDVCLRRCDIESHFIVLDLLKSLFSYYGVGVSLNVAF